MSEARLQARYPSVNEYRRSDSSQKPARGTCVSGRAEHLKGFSASKLELMGKEVIPALHEIKLRPYE